MTDRELDDCTAQARVSSGLPALDDVLDGGFLENQAYLVRGQPGAGKTLLGLHFLTAAPDDEALFINLAESATDIRQDAAGLGFDLEAISFLDLSPSSEYFVDGRSYDVFAPEDVESDSLADRIATEVRALDPDRVFVDPLTQFRYLSPDDHQFRKQVLSFLQFLTGQGCTVIYTSQDTEATPDDDLQFMSDGIVHLRYRSGGRELEVTKFRGSDFQSGTHAVRIDDDGMAVFPELVPEAFSAQFSPEQLSSGVPGIDALLHGGLERGTITILTGPSGAGKTTLGTQFMKEAAGRGERSVIYMFEESRETFLHRSQNINIPVTDMLDRGTLAVKEIEALTLSPEELAHDVRTEVEERGARIVMIDGIDGFRLSLTGSETELTNKLHSLGRYLQNMGVTTVFVGEVQTVTGDFQATKHEVSYLADNIVFLRYLEFEGELRKAIGVLKKRASDFERSLREFEITSHGLTVGEPLSGLRGVLQGTPEWVDSSESPPDRGDGR